MELFALHLLMTGEEVRDIGAGAGVGEWAQQEVNGVTHLEGAGGGDCRPTRRSPAARPPLNDVPTSVLAEKASAGAGGVDARADMVTTRPRHPHQPLTHQHESPRLAIVLIPIVIVVIIVAAAIKSLRKK